MRVADLNWLQLEAYLARDDRIEEVPDLLEHGWRHGAATDMRGRGSLTLTEITHRGAGPPESRHGSGASRSRTFRRESGRRESNPRD